jgi:stage II sporulation protein D
MPMLFTNPFKTEETFSDVTTPFDYGKYSNIKLLHVQTGEVEELSLDTYLYGVVSSEMPAGFEMEALKAQAVVARTYTIYQIENGGKHGDIADICDNPNCCQAWITKENRMARWEEKERGDNWNKIIESVNSTAGKIILYEGKPINALFHANSGGKTELASEVWGGDYPYFQSVETSGETEYTSYKSEVEYSKNDLEKIMLEKNPKFKINYNDINCIKILEYTDSGRVKKIKIGNTEISGVDARILFSLKSSNFNFLLEENKIIFYVIGYGHGVGFSQCGSDYLAKQGKNYEEIIKYYYKNVEISE